MWVVLTYCDGRIFSATVSVQIFLQLQYTKLHTLQKPTGHYLQTKIGQTTWEQVEVRWEVRWVSQFVKNPCLLHNGKSTECQTKHFPRLVHTVSASTKTMGQSEHVLSICEDLMNFVPIPFKPSPRYPAASLVREQNLFWMFWRHTFPNNWSPWNPVQLSLLESQGLLMTMEGCLKIVTEVQLLWFTVTIYLRWVETRKTCQTPGAH